MDKEAFVDTCIKSGYANKKIAINYAKEKVEFTDNDFIEIFRLIERAKDMSNDHGKFRKVEGVKTTKRYKQSEKMGSDRNC